MGTTFLEPVFRRVLKVQILSALLVSLLAWVASGQLATVAALIGGLAVIAGSLAYALVVRPAKVFAVSGKRVVLRHVFAELAKLSLILGLLFGAFATQLFDGRWLLTGLISGLLGHWAAFFSRP